MRPNGGNTMRILAVLSLITATIFSPMMTTKAEAQCLLCGVVGFALGSASNDEQAGASSGSKVIYVAPHIGERIGDPLEVRIVAKRFSFGDSRYRSSTGAQFASLRALFQNAVPEHENFTLLEIMRVVDHQAHGAAVFWFAYIENEKMKPLSELSSN